MSHFKYNTNYLTNAFNRVYNKHMIRKQIHITENQKSKLEELSKETGYKEAEIMRRALEEGLKIIERGL